MSSTVFEMTESFFIMLFGFLFAQKVIRVRKSSNLLATIEAKEKLAWIALEQIDSIFTSDRKSSALGTVCCVVNIDCG